MLRLPFGFLLWKPEIFIARLIMRQDAGKWIQRNKKAVTEDSVTAFLCKKLLNMLTSIHSSFIYFCKRNLACSGCRCHVLIFRLIFPNAIAGTDFYRNFAIGCADFLELCIQGSAVAGLDTDAPGRGMGQDQAAETAFLLQAAQAGQKKAGAVFLHMDGGGENIQGACFH